MTTITVTFPENYDNYGADDIDRTASIHGWGGQEGNILIKVDPWKLPDLTTGTSSSATDVKSAIDALNIAGVTTVIQE